MSKFLCSLVLIIPSLVQAQPNERTWLMGGIELGYLFKSGVTSPEQRADGGEFGFKAGVDKYLTSWVMGGGLGWRLDQISKTGVRTKTKAFYLELSSRYRINSRIHVGPSLDLLFGQDVSFSDTGTNSDDKALGIFLGVRGLYDIALGNPNLLFRAGLQAQTDINIKDRQVTWFQILLEFGIPLEEPKPIDEPKDEPYNVNLSQLGVRFKSGSDELTGNSGAILKAIGAALTENSDQWDKVFIGGHTDRSGKYNQNLRLSKDRAAAVMKVLIAEGVPENRILSAGYGPDRPLDDGKTKEAYAKNRRVEMEILGATGRRSRDLIERVNQIIDKQN